MKLRLLTIMISSLVLSIVVLCSKDIQAETVSLTLKGNVTEQTCTVVAGSEDIYVDLGQWSTKSLNGRVGNSTSASAFNINFENCPSSEIKVQFMGSSVSGNAGLLEIDGSNSSDVAKNIAIELLDSDMTRLSLNQSSKSVTPDSDGNAAFNFYARYISLDTSVTAGIANSSATFTFTYN